MAAEGETIERIGAVSEDASSGGLDRLETLRQLLTTDLDIHRLEAVEKTFKDILAAAFAGGVDQQDALRIARFQQQVGLLLKYKSYAIKAATPLGFSVFFQEPRSGFSFQRHLEHKVEIFHILQARPGAFAFLCEYEDWSRDYEPVAFARWLAGEANPRFERWRVPVQAGDVLILDRVGVVHTVLGCTLEEFATASTDVVERLHDQNSGKPVPASFHSGHAKRLLAELPRPRAHHLLAADGSRRQLESVRLGGLRALRLGSFAGLDALLLPMQGRETTERISRGATAASLFAARGEVEVSLPGPSRAGGRRQETTIVLRKGEVTMLAPGIEYQLSSGAEAAEVVIHDIPPDVAFKVH